MVHAGEGGSWWGWGGSMSVVGLGRVACGGAGEGVSGGELHEDSVGQQAE